MRSLLCFVLVLTGGLPLVAEEPLSLPPVPPELSDSQPCDLIPTAIIRKVLTISGIDAQPCLTVAPVHCAPGQCAPAPSNTCRPAPSSDETMTSFVHRLEHASATTVAAQVSNALQKDHCLDGSKNGLVVDSPIVIVPDEASNCIVVAAYSEYIDEIKEQIARADVEPRQFRVRIKVTTTDANGERQVVSPEILTLEGSPASIALTGDRGDKCKVEVEVVDATESSVGVPAPAVAEDEEAHQAQLGVVPVSGVKPTCLRTGCAPAALIGSTTCPAAQCPFLKCHEAQATSQCAQSCQTARAATKSCRTGACSAECGASQTSCPASEANNCCVNCPSEGLACDLTGCGKVKFKSISLNLQPASRCCPATSCSAGCDSSATACSACQCEQQARNVTAACSCNTRSNSAEAGCCGTSCSCSSNGCQCAAKTCACAKGSTSGCCSGNANACACSKANTCACSKSNACACTASNTCACTTSNACACSNDSAKAGCCAASTCRCATRAICQCAAANTCQCAAKTCQCAANTCQSAKSECQCRQQVWQAAGQTFTLHRCPVTNRCACTSTVSGSKCAAADAADCAAIKCPYCRAKLQNVARQASPGCRCGHHESASQGRERPGCKCPAGKQDNESAKPSDESSASNDCGESACCDFVISGIKIDCQRAAAPLYSCEEPDDILCTELDDAIVISTLGSKCEEQCPASNADGNCASKCASGTVCQAGHATNGPALTRPAANQPAASMVATVYPVADLVATGDGSEPLLTPEQLVDLIQHSIHTESWERSGGPAGVEFFGTTLSLVVRQGDAVHAEVSKLLETLRELQRLRSCDVSAHRRAAHLVRKPIEARGELLAPTKAN